ncbi:multicopper oxidase domain-containing protein [Micromonospora sp. R77]|uniref:multicopper oxidase family protein n=1 Tax=Micromonospora sp. R77 TaxID=2925836 RepID=UPI001F61DA32|nr:multicopper oxidase domain-containing protein [Micromonospora sp. R77]MCI4061305.1 multicopper oxidase domain-containing protein [Micromonospora sp. R77]
MPAVRSGGDVDEYRIAARQFAQQVLPVGLPRTTVWGYGSADHPGTFGYPARTIEARVGRPVQVTWLNQLIDGHGRYLPFFLPVDPTLHWANPPGGIPGRDSAGSLTDPDGPVHYTGPVPLVTHVHGLLTRPEFDGYPEAWFLPDARDIPAGWARVGSWYDRYAEIARERTGLRWRPGSATYRYPNDQPAAAYWFHDHALGLSRLTIHAGLAGFYLLRGGAYDLPPGVLPESPDEIPMLIQDRSFRVDGSLYYPDRSAGHHDRADAAPRPGPSPDPSTPPVWVPDVRGDTMVVNGVTWPVLHVGRRRYRLRLLNGCNGRTLVLAITAHPTARPARAELPLWQIGSDDGFLPAPVRLDRVLLAPAQRADVIVDFTAVPPGAVLYLVNEGADAAHGDDPGYGPTDPRTTGQVLKLVVTGRDRADRSVPPDQLSLPAPATTDGGVRRTRRLLLTGRHGSAAEPGVLLLGTVDGRGRERPLHFDDPVTETPVVDEPEIWELHNHTPHAHPIHLHGVHFRLVGRGPDGTRPPQAQERGLLDTVLAHPGQVTRILARFATPGRFVWHCHNLEHEDNEMMRPTEVLPSGAARTGDGGRAGTDAARLAVGGVLTLGAAGAAALALHRRAGRSG